MSNSRGVALIVVLWVSAILTLLLYSFLLEMRAESSLADTHGGRKKADQLARSAIDKAVIVLNAHTANHHKLSDAWAHSEDEWYEVELGEGVFTTLRPAYSENKVYWGLIDEASKLNLNTATRESLLKLPGMTEEIADSIIDWRDADSNPGPNGAEDSHYATLDPPYDCKDQPFETVEELRYVRGVTAEILWGEDKNGNGILDPGEDADRNGELNYGLAAFVTVYSKEKDVRADGSARLDLNTQSQDYGRELGDVLDNATIQNMQQYLAQNGGYPSVAHVLDVAGVTPEAFKKIVDRLTVLTGLVTVSDPLVAPAGIAVRQVEGGVEVEGRININTAPRQVLVTIPGIDETFVDVMVAHRAQPNVDLSTIGWLLDLGVDDGTKRAQLKAIANFITVRSYQFRIDAVGRIGEKVEGTTRPADEGPIVFRRVSAVLDRTANPVRTVYFKDRSEMGFPYDPWEKPHSP